MINIAKNLITKLAMFAIENPASFLKRTAAVNFSIGSVGLIIGMLINSKIPKKEKRFMIVQEATEGVLDLGVFLVCATAFEKMGTWLVKSHRILPNIADMTKEQIKNAVTTFFKNPKNPVGLSMLAESRIRTIVKATEVGAGLIGTIIAFNIVTPLIRNFTASKLEKWLGQKMDKSQTISPILPAVKLNVNLAYKDSDPFKVFQSTVTSNQLPKRIQPTFTSGSMRI
ncbi:MAG: hypothetical protein AB1782_07025 [Cyanobacteriota bacterium]